MLMSQVLKPERVVVGLANVTRLKMSRLVIHQVTSKRYWCYLDTYKKTYYGFLD